MKCLFCKSDLKNEYTNYIEDLGKRIIIIRNVPAQVCRQCGEKSYSFEVAVRIRELINGIKNFVVGIAEITYTDDAQIKQDFNMCDIIKGAPLSPRVKQVEPTDNFELLLTFNNGEKKKFDAKILFNYPMYASLKNIEFFKLVKADNMCVYWNDDIDICPDILYEQSIPM